MALLVPWPKEDEWVCFFCGRKPLPSEDFCGPQMWHKHIFTCKHERQFECPDCYEYDERYAECSFCGCGEEFS